MAVITTNFKMLKISRANFFCIITTKKHPNGNGITMVLVHISSKQLDQWFPTFGIESPVFNIFEILSPLLLQKRNLEMYFQILLKTRIYNDANNLKILMIQSNHFYDILWALRVPFWCHQRWMKTFQKLTISYPYFAQWQ